MPKPFDLACPESLVAAALPWPQGLAGWLLGLFGLFAFDARSSHRVVRLEFVFPAPDSQSASSRHPQVYIFRTLAAGFLQPCRVQQAWFLPFGVWLWLADANAKSNSKTESLVWLPWIAQHHLVRLHLNAMLNQQADSYSWTIGGAT